MYLLQTIYYSLFNSHLIYGCEIWGQNQTNLWFPKLTKLQNKTLKVINFQSSDSPTGPLYQENKVLKIADFINYKNVLFVRNTLKRENPQVFHEMFIMLNQNHSYNTKAATYHFLDIPQVKTTHFGQYSVKFQASETWNKLQRTQNVHLLTSEPSEFKKALFQAYLAKFSYNTYSNLLFIFMSLMSSLLVTHILDY